MIFELANTKTVDCKIYGIASMEIVPFLAEPCL